MAVCVLFICVADRNIIQIHTKVNRSRVLCCFFMFVYAYVVVVVHRFFGVIVIPLVFVLIQFVIMILHTYTKSFQLVLLNTGHNGLYRWKIHRNTCVWWHFSSHLWIKFVLLNWINTIETKVSVAWLLHALLGDIVLFFFFFISFHSQEVEHWIYL